MELSMLLAISPIDGRYRNKTNNLENYFSEFALIKYRVFVEIEYFICLAEKKFFSLTAKQKKDLRLLVENFNLEDAHQIKTIEQTTNHDVKAVEYFLKQKLDDLKLSNLKEWIHFGLTSQDINNTANPLMLKHFMEQEFLPAVYNTIQQIQQLAVQLKPYSLLARTHGQPASPTNLGKEIMVFVERLQQQFAQLSLIPHTAKFGGATGNFNAHQISYPSKNWINIGNDFVENYLQLQRQQFTTQIEHYDNLASICHATERIHTILIDFCRDIWQYISQEYFTQKTKAGEVGSSAMPHKVNPIDFENAEGNLGIANAILHHLASKLPISRLQRDLTDSTVLRNIGVPFAHSIIALKSIEKGIGKLVVNEKNIVKDLDNNWAVVAEAIQTILRRENYPNPYEALKALTRGNQGINQKTLHQFINKLKINDALKKELKQITPQNYTGVYPKF
ncbi:MAG: adenylosuccinate lyase [Chitinophagaceae bacterium]